MKSEFTTDIATFCVFDVLSLENRLDDVDDWWCTPRDEVEPINSGNVIFVGLGADGTYGLNIVEELKDPQISLNLKVPSGRIFLGAAEETTGGELRPEGYRGGGFLEIETGSYCLSFLLSVGNLFVSFEKSEDSTNYISEPIDLGLR
jgi:hypothetical protein